MACVEFTANSLQFGRTRADEPGYCSACGYEDNRGQSCLTCEAWTCQSCLESRKFGKVMESLQSCPSCLEARMEALCEAVEDIARFDVVREVRAELAAEVERRKG